MTSQEFVIWLRGFTQGCHEFTPTPKQWDMLKDELAEVSDLVQTQQPTFPGGGYGVPNTHIEDLPYNFDPPWTTYTKLTGTGTTSTSVGLQSGSAINFTNAKTLLND